MDVNQRLYPVRRQCVVLIDFDARYQPHSDLVRRTLEPLGYEVFLADRPRDNAHPQGPILRQIVKLMAQADVIIADISGHNPNVMLELGMALTLRKKVIVIGDARTPIPFDIASYRRLKLPEPPEEQWHELADTVDIIGMEKAGSDAVADALDEYSIRIGERVFARRFGAAWIDGLIALSPYIFFHKYLLESPPAVLVAVILAPLIVYIFVCTWLWESTVGKWVLGLKVTNLHGEAPSPLASLGRAFSAVLLVETIGVGFLMCAVGPSYRALDDILSRTMVRRSRYLRQ